MPPHSTNIWGYEMTETAEPQGVFVDEPAPNSGFWGTALSGLSNLSTAVGIGNEITGSAAGIAEDIAAGRTALDRQRHDNAKFDQDMKIDWLGFKRGDNLVRYGVFAVAGVALVILIK